MVITGCSEERREESSRSGHLLPCGGGCGARSGRSEAGKHLSTYMLKEYRRFIIIDKFCICFDVFNHVAKLNQFHVHLKIFYHGPKNLHVYKLFCLHSK